MSQKHWNRWLPSNSDEFRANSDWREQVLQSIGLGRSDFASHDFSAEQQDEHQEQYEVLPEMLLPEPAEPLEVPQISQVPQVPPSPLPELAMPLPSPMLEVPPTPTPAQDSPQMKPWSSPSATPASPMWQSLSEAVLPTPILQPKALRDVGGVLAPPTPLSIFEEVSDPFKIRAPPSTSPKPLDLPGPPEDTGRSSALLRLLSPMKPCQPRQSPMESGPAEGDGSEEPECVLKTLFRMPDFHEILLEGIGLPKPPDMERCKRDRSEALPLESPEPYAKRYRRIWEILQPPLGSTSSASSSSTAMVGASLPPSVSRYEQLGQTGTSILGGHGREVRGTGSMTLPKPVVHVKHEKRKRLAHSEVTRHLWGREVQPLSKRRKKTVVNVTVKPPLLSKKRWSGKAPPTTNELSLSAGQPFVLYEYMEEHPTLMMNMGMGHEVLSYFLPRKKSYEGEALGPLECKAPIQINGPLPHLLGSQMHLKPGQGVSMINSALLQAPLVRHKARENHFLLVWNSKSRRSEPKTEKTEKTDGTKDGKDVPESPEPVELYLRPLVSVCVVGQVEPARLVQSPNSQESKQMLSSCIRHMLHEVQLRWQKDFSGELEDDEEEENQMHKTMVKDVSQSVLQWFPQQGHVVRAEMKEKEMKKMDTRYDLPEAVCLLESMRRGEERLQALGIDNLYQADGSLTKALQDLEVLEQRRTRNDGLQVLRGRWILEQLQITPWNLASKYTSFMKKKETKGSLLAVVGPGDPSNGRLEGVSFLPLYVKHTAECLALAKLCLATDSDIVAKLKQHGVSQDMLEPLGRWDRIALLCTKLGKELEKNSDCTVTGWSKATLPQAKQTPELKKKHQQLLQDSFQRQLQALTGEEKQSDPLTRPDDKAEKHEPLNSVEAEADEAALIEALEDSPPGVANDANEALRFSPQSDEDERMEMQRLRTRLGTEPREDVAHVAPATRPAADNAPSDPGPSTASAPGKVKMLKVVNMSWGDAGRPPQERVLYVLGEENIRLYRELHSANEIGTGYGGYRPSSKLRSQGASNLSRLSEQSKSTKGKRSKDDEQNERVSSISFKDSKDKESDRPDRAEPKASFLKRRKTTSSRLSDAASKLSTQS